MKGILFSDLSAIVKEKELLSDITEPDKWEKVNYQTADISGVMLVAGQMSYPGDLTLKLNLKGWHRVYVAQILIGTPTRNSFKLSKENDFYTYFPKNMRNFYGEAWASEEYIEESLYITADLTDNDFILRKVKKEGVKLFSALAWIRCEELTQDEIDRYKASLIISKEKRNMQLHFDNDYIIEGSASTGFYTSVIDKIKGANVDSVSFETLFTFDSYSADTLKNQKVYTSIVDKDTDGSVYAFWRNGIEKVYNAIINKAHSYGAEIYSTVRNQVSGFKYPIGANVFKWNFPDEHPEFYIVNRDGSVIDVCSYAYDEVHDYVIENLLKNVNYGFDGITLAFCRGVFIGFEKPVVERFKKLYPDIDPFELPLSDKRLSETRCYFITCFMRKLREKLREAEKKQNRAIKLNVIPYFTVSGSKNFGFDLETWAKEGLVDCIMQGLMEHYEVLDDCMRDDNPSLIDLDKYKKQLAFRPIIRRYHGQAMEWLTKELDKFFEISENYGIKFYAGMPWEFSPAETYIDYAQTLYKMGAEKLFLWNANHDAKDIAVWNVIKELGDKEKTLKLDKNMKYRNIYRVFKLKNNDLSHFNINWKG